MKLSKYIAGAAVLLAERNKERCQAGRKRIQEGYDGASTVRHLVLYLSAPPSSAGAVRVPAFNCHWKNCLQKYWHLLLTAGLFNHSTRLFAFCSFWGRIWWHASTSGGRGDRVHYKNKQKFKFLVLVVKETALTICGQWIQLMETQMFSGVSGKTLGIIRNICKMKSIPGNKTHPSITWIRIMSLQV